MIGWGWHAPLIVFFKFSSFKLIVSVYNSNAIGFSRLFDLMLLYSIRNLKA